MKANSVLVYRPQPSAGPGTRTAWRMALVGLLALAIGLIGLVARRRRK